MSKPFEASKGKIVEINAKLLYAVFLGYLSYWSWPTNPLWWGFGFVSVLSGLSAAALTVNALSLIFKARSFKKEQDAFMAQGKEVKSSSLASNDLMQKDGVIRNGR